MSPLPDLVVSPLVVDLVACLTAEFNTLDTANGVPLREICLRPGERMELLLSTTQDECCTGLIWLRPGNVWPSAQGPFPAVDERTEPCDVRRYAVEFELGAARCAPVGTATTLPTCDQWSDVTLATLEDGAALRRALCRFKAMSGHIDRLVHQGQQSRLTTDGGCVGVLLSATIAADNCDCWQLVS
jgi:hypothetical protein